MGRGSSDPRLPPKEARPYRELLKMQALDRPSDDEPQPGDAKQLLALLCGAAALVLKTKAGAWGAAFLCASCLATMRSADEFKHVFTTITYVAPVLLSFSEYRSRARVSFLCAHGKCCCCPDEEDADVSANGMAQLGVTMRRLTEFMHWCVCVCVCVYVDMHRFIFMALFTIYAPHLKELMKK